jgi:nitroimidazol reductase NimA-like FMN-containing flavoprotein (pyridoxamine 5'-phosphate oxidase superfamily)
VSFTMDGSEREAFLADLHVGILSVNQSGRAPLAVPVWYSYQPGGTVSVMTPGDSRKARCLNESGRFSLCVQSEIPMYKYVSVEGAITSTDHPVDPDERRALAHRYLGPEGGDLFLAATAEQVDREIVYRMTPERWFSSDFNKAIPEEYR